MKTTTFVITLIGSFLLTETISAQTNADSIQIKTDSLQIKSDSLYPDKHPPKTSHFEVALNYQNNEVYFGRKDSSVLHYYIPAFSYYHKSGLFATVSMNYLKNTTTSRVDLFTAQLGFVYTKSDYDGQLSVSKYFYNSQSTSVTSEISASIESQNSYDFDFIRVTFTGTLNIGSKMDFAGLFGLEHSFSFFKDHVNITPTFTATASTQNYYNDYYRKRRYTINRKGQTPQTGTASVSGTVFNAGAFRLLDYEPNLPINYTIGKCVFNFTPTYAIPVNPATVSVHTVRENGQVFDHTKEETLSNTFYFTMGVTFSF